MAGSHQPERAATTDLPNQINYVCMSLSENNGTSQVNDSKGFRCNVTKIQKDFYESFVDVFVT